jgi:PAS domain S-box-containing protein
MAASPILDGFDDLLRAQGEAPIEPSHQVQFYDGEATLVAAVGEFLAGGLRADEPIVIVATPAHREALERRLSAGGFDVEALEAAAMITLADAETLLAKLLIRGRPNEVLFQRHVGTLLDRRARLRPHGRVRVYGEMVDLLYQAGEANAAIRLEELWNELQQRCTFSLLCAYAARSFDDEADVRRVCATHTQVLATDSRDRANGCAPCAVDLRPDQMRAIVAEIALRKDVEGELRAAVRQLQATQEQLRRREEELEDLVESAALGLHRLAGDGTILWANRAELEMLGYDEAEYVGRNVADFHVDAALAADVLARLRDHRALRDVEARLRAKDGSIRRVLLTSSAHRREMREGDAAHARCFTRDITGSQPADAAPSSR